MSEVLGNRHHTRHLLNQRFLQALLLDFDAHGREAIEKCRKQSPLGYVKVLGHLVPRELKVEQNQLVKTMSDEQLEQVIATIEAMLEQRAGELLELSAEPATLPASNAPSSEAALDADTAVNTGQAKKTSTGSAFSRCAGRKG